MATVIDELVALLGYDIKGEENLKRFNGSLDSLEKKANKVGEAIGRVAAVAVTAAATAFTLLGKGVIDTSAKFETYEATLTTIEGSSKKAQDALAWITKFAATTPFEVDELTAGFVKLRSYGLDPMDGSMTVLGDTAAGMGKSLNQVVEAMADATTFQFERLRELGLVASQAGDQVTFSWTENGKAMKKTIAKTSTDVTKFLNEVWGKKFGGAMLRQSKTWTGMMSNLSDSWTNFQLRIGQAGFFDTVKNKLAALMDQVAQWQSDGTIDKLAKGLSSAFTTVADVIQTVAERIGTHLFFIAEHADEVMPHLKMFGIVFGLILAKAFPLVTALGLLAFAVEDFLTYLEGGESIIGNFIKWLRDIIPGSEAVENALMALAGAVTGGLLLAFTLAPSSVAMLVGRLVAGLVAALGPALLAGLGGLASVVGPGFAAAFAFLLTPAGWAVILGGIAAALVAYFWDDLIALWNALDFAQLGRAIGNGILEGIRSTQGAIRAAILGMTPNGNISQAGSDIGALGANMMRNANKMGAATAGTGTVQDNRQTNVQTSVNAPVTVHVQQADQAPAAVGQAISGAVTKSAQPARMQGGGGGGAF